MRITSMTRQNLRLPPAFSNVESLVDHAVRFLAPYEWLFSAHAYDVLTQDVFRNHWPEEWRPIAEPTSFNLDNLVALVQGGPIPKHWPDSLQQFISTARSLTLPRNVDSSDFGLETPFPQDTEDEESEALRLAEMNRKKFHEVRRFADIVLAQARASGITKIVDVGAGQGYLTHRLAAHYPCVALDHSETQAAGSKARNDRLGRRRPAADDARPNIAYKVLEVNESALLDVINDIAAEGDGSDKLMLVGLHACGDLSASVMLKSFVSSGYVQSLAVVPCCYNLLTEANGDESAGFPLSSLVRRLVREQNLRFGHTGRNLGCQTYAGFERAEVVPVLSGLVKRCVLDSILTDAGVESSEGGAPAARRKFRLGRLDPQAYSGTILDYLTAATKRMKLEDRLGAEALSTMLGAGKYRNCERELLSVFAVRNILSQVIETLLLADRYLFLQAEGSVSSCALLNLFDATKSPRNMVLMGTKR
ncbi:methyltransferase domain-containing protein [Zopfochytrium polystomum]|nr:methyltransferase domain-containing protein [Zopfochytrium polystomum]